MSTTLLWMITTMSIVFMVVVLPLWLFMHYLTRMKKMKGLSTEDEQTLAKLWQTSVQMEERIKTLETILDEKDPDWRNNP